MLLPCVVKLIMQFGCRSHKLSPAVFVSVCLGLSDWKYLDTFPSLMKTSSLQLYTYISYLKRTSWQMDGLSLSFSMYLLSVCIKYRCRLSADRFSNVAIEQQLSLPRLWSQPISHVFFSGNERFSLHGRSSANSPHQGTTCRRIQHCRSGHSPLTAVSSYTSCCVRAL